MFSKNKKSSNVLLLSNWFMIGTLHALFFVDKAVNPLPFAHAVK